MNPENLENQIINIATELELRPVRLSFWLRSLVREKTISNEEFTRLTGLPKSHSGKLLSRLSPILQSPTKNVAIKKGYDSKINEVTEAFVPRSLTEIQERIVQKLGYYSSMRKKDKRDLDQIKATEETVAQRAIKMLREGDIQGRDIVVLGDNDLTSVGISLLGKARKITVFDLDHDVLRTIEEISGLEKLEIDTVNFDLRSPLPKKYRENFDTVFTDPPYTVNGIGTFLNRAIESIKPRYDTRIYLCYGNSDRARERELPIQQSITARGLLIHEKDFQFNKYKGARSIGSRSSLFLLDWTPKAKRIEPENKRFYTHE